MIQIMNKANWFQNVSPLLKRLIATVGMIAVIGCGEVAPTTPNDVKHFRAITHAVFADDRLWLLQDDGSLASLMPSEPNVHRVDAGGRVLGICSFEGRLSALVDTNKKWTFKEFSSEGWVDRASTSSGGDQLISMDCERSRASATLVTNNRLLQIVGGEVDSIRLSQPIKAPLITATALATESYVWLGLNNGEWGGGLRRISRLKGHVDTIELNLSGELCGGPLNTDCDPVNGLIVSPWRPSCVVAAVGMVHMMSHGRIVEICDNSVRRLYFKPFDPQPPRNKLDNGEPASTIAFFGVARLAGAMTAVGLDGIYRFDEAQSPQFQSMPHFENKSGYRVSFDLPGIALVMTEANARASLSGSVPLIAVR